MHYFLRKIELARKLGMQDSEELDAPLISHNDQQAVSQPPRIQLLAAHEQINDRPPEDVVEKMERSAGLVLNALEQLEHYLAQCDFSLHRYSKEHLLCDLSLMHACGDLTTVGAQFLNRNGRALTEHRIEMASGAAEVSRDTHLADALAHEQAHLPDGLRELIADHDSPIVYGNGLTGYQHWLLTSWDRLTQTASLQTHGEARRRQREAYAVPSAAAPPTKMPSTCTRLSGANTPRITEA